MSALRYTVNSHRLHASSCLLRSKLKSAHYSPSSHHVHTTLRFASNGSNNTPFIQHNPYTREFGSTLVHVTRVTRLLLKYTCYSGFAVSSIALAVFLGAHLYVEKVSLAIDPVLPADEISHFEWDKESLSWTGPPGIGGTDPALPSAARRAIRSAWMSLNWANASSSLPSSDPTVNQRDPAIEFLNIALHSVPKESTITALLGIKAYVYETLGTSQDLTQAKELYQQLLTRSSPDDVQTARVLSKLGNIASLLGQGDEALQYWAQSNSAINSEVSGGGNETSPLPKSPLTCRLYIQNLLKISTYYSNSGQLSQALRVQLEAFKLFNPVMSEVKPELSPAGSIHDLYLKHRMALIYIQHAEVLYALSKKVDVPLSLLFDAAQSSENIIHCITRSSLEFDQSDMHSSIQLAPHPVFMSQRALAGPTASLLRDASRSASSSYNLIGLLLEFKGAEEAQKGLASFEKALLWCGGAQGPSASVPEAEWMAIWQNYTRTRERLQHPER